MQQNSHILSAVKSSGELLRWFVGKTNFKAWQMLWAWSPVAATPKWLEVIARTVQLLLALPVITVDFLIILSATMLYLFSVVLIFLFSLSVTIITEIFKTVLDKAVSPVLRVLSIAAALFIIFYLYYSGTWETIYQKLQEFSEELF